MEQIELRQLEDQCIQEHAPECTAACPLHVEMRTVLAEAARGDFDAALKSLKKRLPFPGIIGRFALTPAKAFVNGPRWATPWPLPRWNGPAPILALNRRRREFRPGGGNGWR
jgi:hypothetical protein